MPAYILKFISGRNEGARLALEEGMTVDMGRQPTLDVVLTDNLVSRQHCRVRVQDNRVFVYDLGSLNGTFINGAEVDGSGELRLGDRLLVGTAMMTLQTPQESEADGGGPFLTLNKPEASSPSLEMPMPVAAARPGGGAAGMMTLGGGGRIDAPPSMVVAPHGEARGSAMIAAMLEAEASGDIPVGGASGVALTGLGGGPGGHGAGAGAGRGDVNMGGQKLAGGRTLVLAAAPGAGLGAAVLPSSLPQFPATLFTGGVPGAVPVPPGATIPPPPAPHVGTVSSVNRQPPRAALVAAGRASSVPPAVGQNSQPARGGGLSNREGPRLMAGTLTEMPVLEFFQFANTNRKDGEYVVQGEGPTAFFRIVAGDIVEGKLERGSEAVMSGAATEKVIYRAMAWRRGRFEFLPLPPGEAPAPRIKTPMPMLFMNGMEQRDKIVKLKAKLDLLEMNLRIPFPWKGKLRDLSPDELDMLQAAYNGRSARHFFDMRSEWDSVLHEFLIRMVESGYLEAVISDEI